MKPHFLTPNSQYICLYSWAVITVNLPRGDSGEYKHHFKHDWILDNNGITFKPRMEELEITSKQSPPWRAFFLDDVEMKKRRGQTHCYIHGSHLILFHRGDIIQEAEQGLQNLPIFIWHQHYGSLNCPKLLFFWNICRKKKCHVMKLDSKYKQDH